MLHWFLPKDWDRIRPLRIVLSGLPDNSHINKLKVHYNRHRSFKALGVHMKAKFLTPIFLVVICAAPGKAGPKPTTPCRVYVVIVEHDEVTVGLTMVGLNKPQSSWYKKHGNKGKYAGVCPLNPPGNSQEAVQALPSQRPSEIDPSLPVYAIVWGEHLVSQPYVYSYTTQETSSGTVSGTVTDNSGNTANVQGTTTTTTPVEHQTSGIKRYYLADGFLTVWNPSANQGKGAFAPVGPLHNHNHFVFTSASTSLLKDGLEQVAEREHLR